MPYHLLVSQPLKLHSQKDPVQCVPPSHKILGQKRKYMCQPGSAPLKTNRIRLRIQSQGMMGIT